MGPSMTRAGPQRPQPHCKIATKVRDSQVWPHPSLPAAAFLPKTGLGVRRKAHPLYQLAPTQRPQGVCPALNLSGHPEVPSDPRAGRVGEQPM
jgi:hypothetical protein